MLDDFDLDDVYAQQAAQAKGGPASIEFGVITSTAPLKADCSGGPEAVTAMPPYSPTIGDLAVMLRGRGATVVIGRIATDQPAPSTIPPIITGSDTFPAGQTFSWRDGSSFDYQSAVRQGATDSGGPWSGAWFYQGTPGAALYGATVTGCSVWVKRAPGGTPGTQPISIYQSSTGQWPLPNLSNPPSPVGSAITQPLGVGEGQWVELPIAVGQAIVDDGAGLMIAAATPMVLLPGVDVEPDSGLLRIDWTRS